MNVQIAARHFHASDALREKIERRVIKLGKFYENITNISVVIDAEQKHLRTVEISLKILNKTIVAKSEEENMGKALDKALNKAQVQLKKANANLKSHNAYSITGLAS